MASRLLLQRDDVDDSEPPDRGSLLDRDDPTTSFIVLALQAPRCLPPLGKSSR